MCLSISIPIMGLIGTLYIPAIYGLNVCRRLELVATVPAISDRKRLCVTPEVLLVIMGGPQECSSIRSIQAH